MAKRLTESFKLQMMGVRRKRKKVIWEKTIPNFRNLNIEHEEIKYFATMRIQVTDLLNVAEKPFVSRIVALSSHAVPLITHIACPVCGQTIELNRHWNCYCCFNGEHERKVYEISKVLPDGIQKESKGAEEVVRRN